MAISSAISALSNTTNPATGVLSSDAAKGTAEAAGKSLAGDFNNFLLLLTTQLKNQDPTQPLDTNQMTQQLATFAGVEQQIATNKNMEKLLTSLTGNKIDQAVNYIGRYVEGKGGESELANKQALFAYNTPAGAKKVTVSVLNESNQAVFTVDGTAETGRHTLVWDGTNNFTSGTMPDGVYHLSVSALDASGADLKATAYTSGKVTAVETAADGTATLRLGKVTMPVASVETINAPAETTTATAN